ncbi:nuclear receptor co-repressor 2 [Sarotherodon galilaeus]
MDGEMRSRRALSLMCLFLTVLQISTPSSGPSTDALKYSTQPSNISVGVGEPAVFHCGVPEAHPNLTFTLYGSNHNYSLTCPGGHVEDIPQALYGSCEMKNGESLAVWTLQGTAFPDNGTRVVCQQLSNPKALSAVLHVYDTGATNVLLIGCIIGGFFGVLLVAALLYTFLVKSESFQECFGGGETEDDMTTIVSKE